MPLTGKLVGQIEIKCGGDVFHEIFRHRPHHISGMSPDKVESVDLHDGEWGTSGATQYWKYNHDGKNRVAKVIVDVLDENTKTVKFKVIEGDLMELYKTFTNAVHVDTKGENDDIVTWTMEYEKQNENVPDPHTLMDFCINLTKDIENHHLK